MSLSSGPKVEAFWLDDGTAEKNDEIRGCSCTDEFEWFGWEEEDDEGGGTDSAST